MDVQMQHVVSEHNRGLKHARRPVGQVLNCCNPEVQVVVYWSTCKYVSPVWALLPHGA